MNFSPTDEPGRTLQPDYTGIITVEPGKRGGKPCIRGLRITVYYAAGGMS
ncbi:MAG: DUF433 domain-containing protein [Desulfurellaceae bacterium]|nr:DUF433 domain-containing protein [Desulfurellaceae bacterium]